jgi:hypothetical protein
MEAFEPGLGKWSWNMHVQFSRAQKFTEGKYKTPSQNNRCHSGVIIYLFIYSNFA